MAWAAFEMQREIIDAKRNCDSSLFIYLYPPQHRPPKQS